MHVRTCVLHDAAIVKPYAGVAVFCVPHSLEDGHRLQRDRPPASRTHSMDFQVLIT